MSELGVSTKEISSLRLAFELKEGTPPGETGNEIVQGLVERVFTDEGFAKAFKKDPETVLGDFDLNDEQRKAILARDPEALRELGVEDILAQEFEMATVRTHHPRCGRIKTLIEELTAKRQAVK